MTDPDAEFRAWAPKPGEHTGDVPTGMALPGYSDFRLVAEGGEGTVYRARQDGLDRFVAVKVINVDDPVRLARFRRELEITVRLGRQHPHIVTVIDTGTTPGGRPCIVMEYHDRGSLDDRLRERGPLPVEDVVAAGVAVADALAFAHAQGFLHRDVKPQNILVLPTSYVLADFGIARMADAAGTTSLQLVSYRHAAPQMIDGTEPSAADDQWSLGSTLFTLLDGAPPFASDNPDDDTILSYMDRVRSAEPRPVRRADVPPELSAVLDRCLSRRREDRFPDAAALRSALAAIDTGVTGWTPSVLIGDFGPRPTPPAPESPPAPRPVGDRTVRGAGSDLAGLTVRLPDDRDALPDFGPTPAGTEASPVVLPGVGSTPVEIEGSPVVLPDVGSLPVEYEAPPDTLPGSGRTSVEFVASPDTSSDFGSTSAANEMSSVVLPDFGPAPVEHEASPGALPGFGPTPVEYEALPGTLPSFGRTPAAYDASPVVPSDLSPAPAEVDVPPVAVLPASPWQRDEDTVALESPPRRKTRRMLVLGVVAVLLGAGIGVLATVLSGPNSQAGRPAASSSAPPVSSAPAPSPPASPGGDPAFAPALNRVADDGGSITLTWSDPTRGTAQFVVVDVTDSRREALVTVAAGTTTYTVQGLDPDAEQYCFQVIAIGLAAPDTQRGASDRVCAVR